MSPAPTRLVALAAALAGALVLAPGSAVATPPPGATTGQKPPELRRARVPKNLLTPIPASGAVPRMVAPHKRPGDAEAWAKADAQVRAIRSKHFGTGAGAKSRAAGIEAVRAMKDPAAFASIYNGLKGEAHDVKLAVLDHFAAGGEEGQYALAWIAIEDTDKAIRAEATRRVGRPPSDAVLAALDEALRSENKDYVNNAGLLAGTIHAIEALPELIFAQFSQSATPGYRGSLGWIAIGKTTSYVANVIPVVGDNSGAFQPVIGQVIEGVVMDVQGCVVTTYHGDVHDSLVAMSSYDSGMDTSTLAWNMRDWWKWFNEQYVPLKQREDQELARAAAAPPSGGAATP
ncbi:MAG: hypothetical protein U0625_09570 [Phycisphaerales bacterium]